MIPNNEQQVAELGKRIQRCYGCFIAYHLRDMYVGEDVTFFCENCKDDSTFPFNEFAARLELPVPSDDEENTQNA